ncbi:MAG: hypothetical protein KIT27_02560 [Legionellales bacterium]|nr:hypothetical protein [Legionellales bacterium]
MAFSDPGTEICCEYSKHSNENFSRIQLSGYPFIDDYYLTGKFLLATIQTYLVSIEYSSDFRISVENNMPDKEINIHYMFNGITLSERIFAEKILDQDGKHTHQLNNVKHQFYLRGELETNISDQLIERPYQSFQFKITRSETAPTTTNRSDPFEPHYRLCQEKLNDNLSKRLTQHEQLQLSAMEKAQEHIRILKSEIEEYKTKIRDCKVLSENFYNPFSWLKKHFLIPFYNYQITIKNNKITFLENLTKSNEYATKATTLTTQSYYPNAFSKPSAPIAFLFGKKAPSRTEQCTKEVLKLMQEREELLSPRAVLKS